MVLIVVALILTFTSYTASAVDRPDCPVSAPGRSWYSRIGSTAPGDCGRVCGLVWRCFGPCGYDVIRRNSI